MADDPATGAKTRDLIDEAIRESEADGLSRQLGPLNLTAIGVAAVIGAGIFVVTGQAAALYAGPAVAISFVIAATAAALSALCYSELASMIPLSGSTYSYAYAGLGTFIAWIIGWDLLLEYLFGAANVANGWSGYFVNLLHQMGINLPQAITASPFPNAPGDPTGIANLPAMLLVAGVCWLLMRGAKETGVATTLLVGVKITTILLFVIIGAFAVTGSNYEPFVPPNTGDFRSFGWTGVFAAAAIVFYSFISFDAVCTAAQEAKNPRRTVPIGVLGSLGIATVLYVIVGVVLVGLVPYYTLNVSNPLSAALEGAGISWLATVVDVGATIGLAASVMALLYSQTRILMRMSEDGMLPKLFRKVDAVRRTPGPNTVICGIACIIMTGFLPLSILTKLISIGTLLAFIIVSASVLVLRRTRPDLNRPFKVPFGPVIPILAIVVSLAIMATLELDTWLRLIVWLLVGLVVYFGYSKRGAERVIMERAARRDAGLPVPPAVPDH